MKSLPGTTQLQLNSYGHVYEPLLAPIGLRHQIMEQFFLANAQASELGEKKKPVCLLAKQTEQHELCK